MTITPVQHDYDVLIIGSGLAALTTALSLPATLKVAILCKGTLNDNASRHAQGGIAAALPSASAIESHVADTLIAGAGLCDESAVRHIITHSHDAINWLMAQAVSFDKDASGQIHLTKEGGHGERRIYHCADHTGFSVMQSLNAKLKQAAHVSVYEGCFAESLCIENERCVGVKCRIDGVHHHFSGTDVVLATGGLGQVYTHTTSPAVSTGDGVAMAYRAGCRLANCEFIQFHPTGLNIPNQGEQTFLISEALRGEGALLIDSDGYRFMPSFDDRAELAPRDIVARSIIQHKLNTGKDVYLDISHRPADFIRAHFSSIAASCLGFGIDITSTPIPVTPVQHYFCGGVLTDNQGRTDIHHLYAVGEVACTGLHGANRLASNSLLECVVIGRGIAQDIISDNHPWQPRSAPKGWSIIQHQADALSVDTKPMPMTKAEIKTKTQSALGVMRNPKAVADLLAALTPCVAARPVSDDADIALIERYNLTTCAYLIAKSALARTHSIGGHFWAVDAQQDEEHGG